MRKQRIFSQVYSCHMVVHTKQWRHFSKTLVVDPSPHFFSPLEVGHGRGSFVKKKQIANIPAHSSTNISQFFLAIGKSYVVPQCADTQDLLITSK